MRVTAQATRSGDWWAVEVPEVPGAFTQARRLDQVAAMAADAVAALVDVDPSTIEVALAVDLDPQIAAVLADAREAVEIATTAQSAASTAMRLAVKLLRHEEGMTARETAALLGVSHQRVSQLES